MNNLEYLNHISQTSRPVARKTSGPKKGLIPKILLGGLGALAVIGIIAFIINITKPQTTAHVRQIYYRTSSLNSVLTDYNRNLKSSDLRAIANSLSGALTGATAALAPYFAEIQEKPDDYDEKFLADEAPAFTELSNTLRNAKLNGILDRIYAVQIQLQVSLLISLISQTYERTDDSYLRQALETYDTNLTLIKQKLETYANPSD